MNQQNITKLKQQLKNKICKRDINNWKFKRYTYKSALDQNERTRDS